MIKALLIKKVFFVIFIAIFAFSLFSVAQKSDISEAQVSSCAAPPDVNGMRIFITSGKYTGIDLSSDAAADTICQNAADGAGLQGTYAALVYLGARNPNNLFLTGKSYWNFDKYGSSCDWHEVADSSSTFFGGSLESPINYDQDGGTPSYPNGTSVQVWTNYKSVGGSGLTLMPTGAASTPAGCMTPHGQYWENACISENVTWTGTNSIGVSYSWYGQSGVAGYKDPTWDYAGQYAVTCNPGAKSACESQSRAIYCVQQKYCKPSQPFGCGVCNASGTAFVDDSTKCATGQTCSSGVCAASCTNACTSGLTQCNGNGYQTCAVASNGCTAWSSVTACASGQTCSAGACSGNTCTPSCSGKTCGSDGCGGSCGTCASGQSCNSSGACVAGCTPNCSGKACGSDGCGGSCGNCTSGQSCNSSGVCVACAVSCPANTCGSDGCGGTCVCASGKTCSSGSCISTCQNICSSAGLKQCDGGSNYQTCGDYNNDTCLEWSADTPCSGVQTCSDGVCGGNCTTHASKKCAGGNLYWYDSCGDEQEVAQNCGSNSATANTRCSGTWIQKQTLATDCVNDACTQNETWTNVQDCSAGGKVCSNGNCAVDTQPPVMSDLSPTGGYIHIPTANISLTTNESSTCKYADTNIAYDAMTKTFNSTDKLHHSATVTLSNYGNYAYYVRCKDSLGNTDLTPGTILLIYTIDSSKIPVTPPPDTNSDVTPPVISDLAPASDVTTANVTISGLTDEKATCKYDTSDASYDKMKYALTADKDKTSHSKAIVLPKLGSYAYYIRCKDTSGNKDTASAKISFNYSAQTVPVISNAQPAGQIYQKEVALMVYADKISTCHYSTADTDFDSMPGVFTTADGLMQSATVTLSDPGSYNYFARCQGSDGSKDDKSTLITFEYVNPNASQEAPASDDLKNQSESSQENSKNANVDNVTTKCAQIKTGAQDGTCDPGADCVCDPDCGINDQPEDPDCSAAAVVQNNSAWLIAIPVGIGAVILIVVIIMIIIYSRRKGGDGGGEQTEEQFEDSE